MNIKGTVLSIDVVVAGVDVLETVAAGATEVVGVDAVDLPADGGHVVLPDGSTVHYVSADHDTDTVVLAGPLPVGVDEGDRLLLSPVSSYRQAVVHLDDGGEVIPVRVPHVAQPSLPVGVREDGGGEFVSIAHRDGAFWVADVFDRPPLEVWGDPDGERVEIAEDGVRLFVTGFNGQPYETVSMTSGQVSFGVTGQDGTLIGGVSASGHVTGRRASFADDMTLRGVPLLGRFGGGAQQGWLDRLPRGLHKVNTSNAVTSYGSTERAYVRLAAYLEPGRSYKVVGVLYGTTNTTGGVLRGNIRYVFGSGSATTSSTELFAPTNSAPSYTGILGHTVAVQGFLPHVETLTRVNMILTYTAINGTNVAARNGLLYVEDVGPQVIEEGDPDEDPKTDYTTEWVATASRQYDKTGARIPSKDDQIDLWYWGAAPTQAENAAVLFGGQSVISSDPLDLGVTVPQALNGASIHQVQVYLSNASWAGDTTEGVTTINTLGGSALPETKTIDGTVFADHIAEGAGVWIDLPPSWWTNGANTGVTIGDKDGVTLDGNGEPVGLTSGLFQGPGDPDPPRLRVVYAK